MSDLTKEATCPFCMDDDHGHPWLCDALQNDGEPRQLPEQRSDGSWPSPPDWRPLRTADRLVTISAPPT